MLGMNSMQKTRESLQYQRLLALCRKEKEIAVAFSGGVDSTLLAKAAFDALGNRAVALTVRSDFFSQREEEEAAKFADFIGITHKWIDMDISTIPNFEKNPHDRCYYCKKMIMQSMIQAAKKLGRTPLAEASNTDDLDDLRPGMRAIEELGILSPFLDLGISKKDVRAMSVMLGLPTANKPSFACLASRIPYGESITSEKLKQIDRAESYLFSLGFSQLRVRHHDNIARIEVPDEDILHLIAQRHMVESKLRELGFNFVCLDLAGFSSGRMNQV